MKKLSYYVFTIVFLFSFILHPSAKSVVVIEGTDVRIRDKATTSGSNVLLMASKNMEFNLIDLNVGSKGNGCSKDWYKIEYGSNIGYVCSEFASVKEVEEVKPEDYESYQEYLKKLGFPDTYIKPLTDLHVKRPNWKFNPQVIDLDFNYVVENEHHKSGRSLIEDYNRIKDGYKSLASWSYNYFTDKFYTGFTGGEVDRWYAASKETIAYHMDPRNFFNESQIFMFETQSYNSSLHTREGIEKMLKGTFMETGYADEENKKTFVDAFLDAAIQEQVSPYMLISRVVQEVGAKGSVIVSGTVKGYEGYYNFYNIGAAGDSKDETIANGLKKAVSKGWNTKYKAIVGGAIFVKDGYIEAGQDTLYLTKWDVINDKATGLFSHQYMQNIEAPKHEAVKTFNAYANMNQLDNELVFNIPIYKNMPDETKMPNKGNPNNYLKDLTVNGDYLFKEPSNETEFTMNLSSATSSIEIAASKVSSKAKISGVGSVSIKGKEQIVPIIVTAENGETRIYNIKITRDSDIALSISEILNISNIKTDGTYIYGSKLGTDISEILNKLTKAEDKATITATDKDNKEKKTGIISTGDKIKIKTNQEEKELTFLIYGDVNADGEINKVDAAAILRHYYKYVSYDGVIKMAADVNKDNSIDKVDVAAVLRHLYGYATIEQ